MLIGAAISVSPSSLDLAFSFEESGSHVPARGSSLTFGKERFIMWKCKCGESHEDSFDSCWSCGADRSAGALISEPVANSPIGVSSARKREKDGSLAQSPSWPSAKTRYRDAYLIARTTTAFGVTVKAVAVGLGGLIILAGILAGAKGDNTLALSLCGILVGIIVGLPIYLFGVLLAAHGEVLKATLDTAVQSSPFLKKEEIAQVMSL